MMLNKKLRRFKNRIFHGTPIRSYKDVIEGVDFELLGNERVEPEIGVQTLTITTKSWEVAINLQTLEMDDDGCISFDYSIVYHIEGNQTKLSHVDEKELYAIFEYIIVKQVEED